MNERVDPRLVRLCNVFASISSLVVLGVGLTALAGWNLRIAALVTWGAGPAMAPNNAACMIMAALSLWLQRDNRPSVSANKLTAKALAALVSLVSLLTLGEHLFRHNLGIDGLLLLRPPAGQIANTNHVMSPITAGALLLISVALLGIDWRTRKEVWPSQFLCLGAASLTVIGLFGLILGSSLTHSSLSLPTALNLSLLTGGLLSSRPSWSAGGVLVRVSPGARFVRRVFPATLLFIGLLAWLFSVPLLSWLSLTWLELSAMAIVSGALLGALLMWISFLLDQGKSERRQFEEPQQLNPERLDRIEEPADETSLRRKVAAGLTLAILVTGVLGSLSWRVAHQADEDADWVSRSYEVSTSLESTLRHLLDVDTAGRGFAETGDERFLQPYRMGQSAVAEDVRQLQLIVDASQSHRLQVLVSRADSVVNCVHEFVVERTKTDTVPPPALFEQGKQTMDAARRAVADMQVAEGSILVQRARTSQATRRFNLAVISLGSVLGIMFLSFAANMFNREIGISTRARDQLKAWNTDLERRVAERTEALQQSLAASKEAVKQLAVANEVRDHLAAVVDSSDDAILSKDLDGIINAWNRGATTIFGYSAEEMIGRPMLWLFPPERVGEEADILRHIRHGESVEHLETVRVRKGGARTHISATISPIHDRSGVIIGASEIARDITERKRVEAALRESEANFSNLVNLVPQFVWICTNDGRNVYFNERWFEYTGLTAEQSHGNGWSTPFHPEDVSAAWDAWNHATATGAAYNVESRLRAADGSYRWFLVRGEPVRDAAGSIVKWFGTSTDIHEMKRAQAVMHESLEQFQAMSNGIPQLAWMARADGSIFWYNQRWYEYTGTTYEQMQGWGWQSLHDPGVLPRVMERWMDAIDSSKSFEMEFPLRGADGLFRIFLTRVLPVSDSDGHVVRWFGTHTDITERKEAEEASSRARTEAEEANRAKSNFLANMSHEIRTPMNAIMGMTYLALRADPPPQQRKYLSKISGAADSLLAIINDILDFSKMEAGKMELENVPFSLKEVLSNLHDIVVFAAEQKNIVMVFSAAPDVRPDLVGDPLRLGQILINLVNNAIKFTQAGQVAVGVSAEDLTATSTRLKFSVSDTGIGMSPEQVSRLFQAFNQADASHTRKFGGTGLGLAISKQLCDLMGGTLTAETELGKGTTFTLRAEFPLASATVHVPLEEESFSPKRRSILIVDDNPSDRQRLSGILERSGFRTQAVSSGEAVLCELSRASEVGDPFALVLMGCRSPASNGIESARQIQDRFHSAHIPAILMVTAFDREGVMGNESNPGLSGFLIKPVRDSLLVDTIADIFSREAGIRFNRPEVRFRQETTNGSATLAGRHVLLVEDNELNRDLAGELLAELGISVTIALNGREAVDRALSEPFDLVLMDIQMPIMDGVEAARLIRADPRAFKLPIVAMTAHAIAGDYKKSLDAGMNDHLTKPINPNTLRKALLKWMPAKVRSAPPDIALTETVRDDDYLPKKLFPFDIQAVLKRTNGKPRLVRKMMLSFRKQYAYAATDLRQLIEEGKMEEAQRLAHTLKGIARTLEAAELGDAAFAVENALRSGDVLYAEPLIERMEKMLAPAIAAATSLEMKVARTGDAGTLPETMEHPRLRNGV